MSEIKPDCVIEAQEKVKRIIAEKLTSENMYWIWLALVRVSSCVRDAEFNAFHLSMSYRGEAPEKFSSAEDFEKGLRRHMALAKKRLESVEELLDWGNKNNDQK